MVYNIFSPNLITEPIILDKKNVIKWEVGNDNERRKPSDQRDGISKVK